MTWLSAVPLIAALAAAQTTPTELERAAQNQVAQAFEHVGRRTPVRDEALCAAARKLADVALKKDAHAAAELITTTSALSVAGAWDPSPRILVIKGSPRDEPLRLLEKRPDLSSDAASDVGVGAAVEGEGSAIVLLLAQRRVRLDAFARRYSTPPGVRELCGALEPPLTLPEVALTRPDGTVEKAGLSKRGEARFCARVPIDREGRYTVEVLGRGPKGPEVAALFFVEVGKQRPESEGPLGSEPQDVSLARREILERMNALRQAQGVKPLEVDPALSAVAQAYSEKMAREHFFAHVSPGGETVGQRLRAAGYPYLSAGENLGSAPGPLAAHFGIEHSPGHRKNLLDATWSRVGIGVAVEEVDGRKQTLLTEVFVDPATPSSDPPAEAYRAIAQKRAELKLPGLERNAVLDGLAVAHARRALALDTPKAELPGSKLHEQVFAALDAVKSVSVDLFVTESPVLIDDSKALGNARYRLVGVGAVKGSSARFGKGKYWVVVIYAAK